MARDNEKFVRKCYQRWLLLGGFFAEYGYPTWVETLYQTSALFLTALTSYFCYNAVTQTENSGVKFSSGAACFSSVLGFGHVFQIRYRKGELLESGEEMSRVVHGFKDERAVDEIMAKCTKFTVSSIVALTGVVLCYEATPALLLVYRGFEFDYPYCLIIPYGYIWKPRGFFTYVFAYGLQLIILTPVTIMTILGFSVVFGYAILLSKIYLERVRNMLVALKESEDLELREFGKSVIWMDRNEANGKFYVRFKNILKSYQYVRNAFGVNKKLIISGMELSFVGYVIVMLTSILAILRAEGGQWMVHSLSFIIMVVIGWVFFVFCFTAEKFADFNERLMNECYSLQWYAMNKEEKKTLTVFMCQLQRPLTFKVFGTYVFSLNLFAHLTNKVYSLLNILTFGR